MCQFPTGLVHENRGENPCIPAPLWSSKVGCIPVLFTVDIHHHLSFLGTRRVLSLSTDVSVIRVIISIPAKAGGKQQPRSSCWKRCCSARFSMVRHGVPWRWLQERGPARNGSKDERKGDVTAWSGEVPKKGCHQAMKGDRTSNKWRYMDNRGTDSNWVGALPAQPLFFAWNHRSLHFYTWDQPIKHHKTVLNTQ